MQHLQNASKLLVNASNILDGVFEVVLLVREIVARQQKQTDCTTLVHLRALGILRKRPGISLSDLAVQLALTLSATSRMVDCLVKKGYIERKTPENNRRSVALYLTPAGYEQHYLAAGMAQTELAKFLARMDPKNLKHLEHGMLHLRDAIAKDIQTRSES